VGPFLKLKKAPVQAIPSNFKIKLKIYNPNHSYFQPTVHARHARPCSFNVLEEAATNKSSFLQHFEEAANKIPFLQHFRVAFLFLSFFVSIKNVNHLFF
jgi:hypothetical protein